MLCLASAAGMVGDSMGSSASFPPAKQFRSPTGMAMRRAGEYQISSSEFPDYGVPLTKTESVTAYSFSGSHTLADYYGTTMMIWYNMVRVAPIEWRNYYMIPNMQTGDTTGNNILQQTHYPSVNPQMMNQNLIRLAKASTTPFQTKTEAIEAHAKKIHDFCYKYIA